MTQPLPAPAPVDPPWVVEMIAAHGEPRHRHGDITAPHRGRARQLWSWVDAAGRVRAVAIEHRAAPTYAGDPWHVSAWRAGPGIRRRTSQLILADPPTDDDVRDAIRGARLDPAPVTPAPVAPAPTPPGTDPEHGTVLLVTRRNPATGLETVTAWWRQDSRPGQAQGEWWRFVATGPEWCDGPHPYAVVIGHDDPPQDRTTVTVEQFAPLPY